MTHSVTVRPSALADLTAIYDWVADEAGAEIAGAYRKRLLAACSSLGDFPSRGSRRDDLAPGVRTISFEGRALIAYVIRGQAVDVLRILHHGRDVRRAFEEGSGG